MSKKIVLTISVTDTFFEAFRESLFPSKELTTHKNLSVSLDLVDTNVKDLYRIAAGDLITLASMQEKTPVSSNEKEG